MAANVVPLRHKDLHQSLGNIKTAKQWLDAATKLGFSITRPRGGSSHSSIRKVHSKPEDGIQGLITTVYDGMGKQVNQKVFKKLLEYGVEEDDLWRALGMMR
jgi:hypothetical protein